MTVAYAYFKFLTDRENYQSLVYHFPGSADVQIIVEKTPAAWVDMAITGKVKAQTKEPAVVAIEDTPELAEAPKKRTKLHKLQRFHKKQSCTFCLKVFFVLLGLLAVTLSFGLIAITVVTSIATKAYDADTSSRLVAMVLLAATAAMAAAMVIYAEVAVFKKQAKPMHATVVVLLVLVIIQALIAGISVNVTSMDELRLGKSLADSFKLARDDSRHAKLWATTQYDLNCCGVYGPDDYRGSKQPLFFPPDVPISCCPAYDSNRSDLVQEKEREFCKAKRSFYDVGCKDLVITVFKETASMVLSVTITLIVVELILILIGGMLNKNVKFMGNAAETS